jgi:tRNA dimethylallyltransferase
MKMFSQNQWPVLLTQHLKEAKRPLIVILGPTASGKTGFSLELAHALRQLVDRHSTLDTRLPTVALLADRSLGGGWAKVGHSRAGEIINADSRQLYRHLDIGTAKVTEAEKAGVPHHLFGVLDPSEDVTIAQYKEMAEREIDAVLERGNVPVLVGGSMLYISAIIDGLDPLPPVPKALREKLEAEYDIDKGKTLYARLQEIDPKTAASFHPNNRPYVVRAMAIYEDTGSPPSSLKKTYDCPYDLLLLGMYWERADLTKRIKARTPLLLQAGWVEEVLRLREMGFDAHTPAMKSHGYREVLASVEARVASTRVLKYSKLVDDVSHDPELIEAINAKTRQYAKRQMTWWKHDPRIHWIAMG